ncbi:hypothetical protein BGZ83_012158 [Gryganskiella cystojenkinii]|nr:hypothetical protein BGZ83_012158 [Gryganskiella cystojenkinii]
MFGRSPSPPIVKVPGHYGDIMSKRDTTLSLPDGFTGFERILLTANGNLQRLISAYFNKTVTVKIVENSKVPLTEEDKDYEILARFQREVDLLCQDKVFCNAKSQVLVKDPKVYDLIVNKGVGIGQIFRYLDKLPSFELHGLGRTENTFWREYSLRIPGVDCRLLEVFPNSLSSDNWLDLPAEQISWDVEMAAEDQLSWVNPDPEAN